MMAFNAVLRRYTGRLTVWVVFLIGLALGISTWQATLPAYASQQSPEVDNSSLVVSSSVEDFTFSNGMAYWTYCAGDLNNYSTFLMAQQINSPNSKAALLEQKSTACVSYRELVANPASLFYKNETNSRIERRLFLDISTPINLYAYTNATEPTGLALVDDYIYWSAKDQTIRRISIYGGNVQKVADTIGVPADISVDDENIWYGTSAGVYWIKRNCTIPCTGSLVYKTNAKKIFAAGKLAPLYKAAVFWIANNKTGPDTVESWDCNVPNVKGCFHKILYQGTPNFSVDGLAASDHSAFWIEIDTVSWTSRLLRRAPRDCPSPCASLNIDTLIDAVSPIGPWSPTPMILDDVDIYFKHQGVSKIAQDAPPLVWNFVYDGMEVTQAVQSLANDMPLVIDKPTYVRLYAHLAEGSDVIAPEAQLAGTYNGVPLPGSPLQPVRRPARFAPGAVYNRDAVNASWLFELPREWTEQGTIVLKATIDPRKLYDSTPPSSPSTNIPFTYRPPICVVALRVSQHGPTARYTDPGFQLAIKTASLLLPTSDIWVYHQNTVLEEGVWPFYSPYELPDDDSKLLANIWMRDQFSDDPDECDAAGARTLYTGLIHPFTNTGNTNGLGRVGGDQTWTKLPEAGNAWGVNYAGWPLVGREATLAHEFGHNFDRLHVNCPDGGPADPDSNYPYADPCVLSESTGPYVYFGFDPILSEAIGPTEGSDLMSYNPPRWISNYTWKKIFDYNAPIPQFDVQTVSLASTLILKGTVNTNNPASGSLDYAWVMPAGTLSPGLQAKWLENMSPVQPLATGSPRYYVRFLGIGNIVLAERDVTLLTTSDDPASAGLMFFNLTTTAPGGVVVKLQLMQDSTVLDTLTPGLFVPQLTVTKPSWGAVVDQSLTVEWTASEQSGDTLKFIIQFSPDLGQHWQTLATDITSIPGTTAYSANFDASALPGSYGLEALVRVIASDGFNTTIAVSDKFLTVLKTPEAFVSSPPEGIWYQAGESIILEGSANDPEDGHIPSGALNWFLNNVNYGSGSQKQVAGLAPGTYEVKLNATDLDYKTGSAVSNFTIAPWKIGEGTAKLDGRCTDAAYANTSQIQLKPYSDHNQGNVYAVRNDRFVWFCFSGLEKGANYANSFVGVRLDADYSQDNWAQSSDYAFFVRPDGSQFTKQGNGAGGYNDAPPSFVDYSLASRVRLDVSGNTWSAELRIEYYFLGMGEHIGIDLGHYWVSWQGDDYHWPYNAKYNQPKTWANNYAAPAPEITMITPNSIILPKVSQILDINGLNFNSSDVVVWDGLSLATNFISNTNLTATVPGASLAPGEHMVQVQKAGSGGILSNPVFMTVNNPIPVLNSLSPGIVMVGSGQTGIEITGSNFVPGAIAYWDNKPLDTVFINQDLVKVLVSGSDLSAPGKRKIVVANPGPTSGVSNALQILISHMVYLPNITR